jgi:uncharacterized membrane protein
MKKQKQVCQICHRTATQVKLMPAGVVRPAIVDLIKRSFPDWTEEGYVCEEELKKFRYDYLYRVLEEEKGELSHLEKEVIEKLNEFETLVANVDREYDTRMTFGQRVSDRIAIFGGSWRFIFIFACTIIIWMAINSYLLLAKPFDPYPFILLNLVLSCLASVQAPVILMSQNRQESRDRKRAEHDYKINLKAELEIQQLHQKIDHLLNHQWERMVGIQELQMEMLEEIRSIKDKK